MKAFNSVILTSVIRYSGVHSCDLWIDRTTAYHIAFVIITSIVSLGFDMEGSSWTWKKEISLDNCVNLYNFVHTFHHLELTGIDRSVSYTYIFRPLIFPGWHLPLANSLYADKSPHLVKRIQS